MAIRNVFVLGDDVLRKKAKVVKKIDKRILELLDDMVDTLHEKDGVGLAAPQVGILKRVLVVDVGEGPIELINPIITSKEGEQLFMEGCLSYPGHFGYVERPAKVKVEALDREGNEVEIEGEGILAVVICHETDHLNGVMFVDKVKGEIYTAEQVREMREQEKGREQEKESAQEKGRGKERAQEKGQEQEKERVQEKGR